MKILLGSIFTIVSLFSQAQQPFKLIDTLYLQPIEVNSIRASEKAPFSKVNLNKKQIVSNNLGLDLPYLLNQTPSVVVNSDAGNGIGYTGIRIRGTDGTRINVTLNGIPYNDAESQGTFFVDLPDFSSSVNKLVVLINVK
jgi:iron complex outermembrane receptor protein